MSPARAKHDRLNTKIKLQWRMWDGKRTRELPVMRLYVLRYEEDFRSLVDNIRKDTEMEAYETVRIGPAKSVKNIKTRELISSQHSFSAIVG